MFFRFTLLLVCIRAHAVHVVNAHGQRNVTDAIPVDQHGACYPFPVSVDRKVFSVSANGSENVVPDKCGLMRDASARKKGEINGLPIYLPQVGLAIRVQANLIPKHDVFIVLAVNELLHDAGVSKGIAGIHKDEPITRGARNAFIHGVVDAGVRFRNPVLDARGVLFNHGNAVVSGCAVNDDVFNVGVGLTSDRSDGFFQPVGIVAVNGDDRDSHGVLVSLFLERVGIIPDNPERLFGGGGGCLN